MAFRDGNAADSRGRSMFRKLAVLPALLLVLTGCGGGSKDASTTGAGGSSSAGAVATTSDSASPAVCPSEATKKLAKTRFAVDAGLAFGAFHRYIYKPYQAGTFKSGADGRTKAFVKGGAAALFAANRLNAARKMVNADPSLCKVLKAPIDAVWTKMTALVDKVKSGNVNPTEIDDIAKEITGVKDGAAGVGANIKERVPPGLG